MMAVRGTKKKNDNEVTVKILSSIVMVYNKILEEEEEEKTKKCGCLGEWAIGIGRNKVNLVMKLQKES